MRKTVSAFFAGTMILGASTLGASAQNMGDKMMGMMQCSASCSTQYMQCLMSANQLAGTPQEGLNQVATNFNGSTACGQAAMACQTSCN